jgi:hypothetical protein
MLAWWISMPPSRNSGLSVTRCWGQNQVEVHQFRYYIRDLRGEISHQTDHAFLEYYHVFSPFFKFYNDEPLSNWQEEFRTTWNHLQQRYGYFNHINFRIRTDVYLDPVCSLAEFKQISQASIHFEPILQMMTVNLQPNRLTTDAVTDTRFIRNPPGKPFSRREAITAVQSTTSWGDLLGLREDMGTSNTWAISLRPFPSDPSYAFRVAPQCRTVDDVIEWADFAISFVEASLSCALSQLLRLPSTNAGFHRFLAGRNRGIMSVYDRNTILTRKFGSSQESDGEGGDDPAS